MKFHFYTCLQDHQFVSQVVFWLKLIIKLIIGCIAPDISEYSYNYFLILNKNIYCGYSLEAPPRGSSNEYPQHMLFFFIEK